MDDQQTGVNPQAVEDNSLSPAPSDETKTTETVESETTKPEGEEVNEEAKPVTAQSKKGAEARIRELNTKAKLSEERANSLAQQLEQFTQATSPPEPQAPYQPQVEPGAEISPEQYKADVQRAAMDAAYFMTQQQRMVDNIRSDADRAINEYPELNPDSDNFDRELNDSVTEATLAYVRANPAGSVKKFVDKLMKPYKRSLSKEVAKETETITKQVYQQALRPTSAGVKEKKSYQDMSTNELEKELGVVY